MFHQQTCPRPYFLGVHPNPKQAYTRFRATWERSCCIPAAPSWQTFTLLLYTNVTVIIPIAWHQFPHVHSYKLHGVEGDEFLPAVLHVIAKIPVSHPPEHFSELARNAFSILNYQYNKFLQPPCARSIFAYRNQHIC